MKFALFKNKKQSTAKKNVQSEDRIILKLKYLIKNAIV